jgi:hypothetical protein
MTDRPGLAAAALILGVLGLAALPFATTLIGQETTALDPSGVPFSGAVALMVSLVCGLLAVLFGLVARGTEALRWLALTGAALGGLVVVAFVVALMTSLSA